MNRYEQLQNCRLWADLALDHFGFMAGLMPCIWNGRLTSRMGQARCKIDRETGERSVILEYLAQDFERATQEQRDETAAHEAAHGVVWLKHGPLKRGSRADHHGPVWQATMRALGFEPNRCHSVDTTGLGRKSQLLTCLRCGTSLGSCTPAKARRLRGSAILKVGCCGTIPASALQIVDARGR